MPLQRYAVYAACCGQGQGCLCSGEVAQEGNSCWYNFQVSHEKDQALSKIEVVIVDGVHDPRIVELEYDQTVGDCWIYHRVIQLKPNTDYDFYFLCYHGQPTPEDRDPEGTTNYNVDVGDCIPFN